MDVVDDRNTRSHSMRKFGVNLGRGGDATRREIDHCGCWKSRDRQSDTYAKTTIPFVDAKVAKILAVGKSYRVLYCKDSSINDVWNVDRVVPVALYCGRCGRRQTPTSPTVCH